MKRRWSCVITVIPINLFATLFSHLISILHSFGLLQVKDIYLSNYWVNEMSNLVFAYFSVLCLSHVKWKYWDWICDHCALKSCSCLNWNCIGRGWSYTVDCTGTSLLAVVTADQVPYFLLFRWFADGMLSCS